jgi:hypothetical protein
VPPRPLQRMVWA